MYLVSFCIRHFFQFEGQEIALDPKVGVFVTMNPENAGRTELLASLKALFRPVVCIMPDMEIIGFTMLFCEGFLQAKVSTVYRVLVSPSHCTTTYFSKICLFTQRLL